MRVLIAPDSFGGTLSAVHAAGAMAAGWRQAAPHDVVEVVPLSDGGPGFVAVLSAALGGRLLPTTVTDPIGRPVAASVLLARDRAYVESAQACGLHLLTEAERDVRRATTEGVGGLVRTALAAGAAEVVVGLGGSATNDGGAGLLTGLGVSARTADQRSVPRGGAALGEVDRLDLAGLEPALSGAELVLACDVDSPLLGQQGASAVYGPQKGATDADVAALDQALTHWADVVERDLGGGRSWRAEPGAGAAGGLGFALLALGGRRVPGIETVLRLVGLAARVSAADLVVTGEGSFDQQSLRGKVVSGVAAAAGRAGLPCLVVAGQVSVGRREMAAAGVEAAYSVAVQAGSVSRAKADAAAQLSSLVSQVARQWSRPPPRPRQRRG